MDLLRVHDHDIRNLLLTVASDVFLKAVFQEEISLMEIELFTGRHHQIRVQMAHAGMPLLGDSKYGSEEDKEFSRQIGVKNVALCAFRLQFIHPATGKNVKFERMPEEEIFLPFFGNRI